MNNNKPTLLWHDYETWTTAPQHAPAQFAAIRTDYNLNVIGESLTIYCQPSPTLMPSLDAVNVHGITPQFCTDNGLGEFDFFRTIHDAMQQPNTCSVGFNSIKFDDEVSRFGFYRNFLPIYDREWQNNCSRWDIIDLIRMCCVLKPDGIKWPPLKENKFVFNLDKLAEANGIEYQAHDALGDVKATIELAKLVKNHQPKLYEYYFQCRSKHKVEELLNKYGLNIFLHISSKYYDWNYLAPVVKLLPSAKNTNKVYVFNLNQSPEILAEKTVTEIVNNLLNSQTDEPKIQLIGLQKNRCPAIATSKFLTQELAEQHFIDIDKINLHHQKLIQMIKNTDLLEKIKKIDIELANALSDNNSQSYGNFESGLYDGFFSSRDEISRRNVGNLAINNPAELINQYLAKRIIFQDDRLNKLLPIFLGINFYNQISDSQLRNDFKNHCQLRITPSLAEYQNARKTNITNPKMAKNIAVLDRWRETIHSN